MRKLVDFFLSNRWLVFALLLVLIIGGVTVMLHLPLEAFPDLTNNQVVVTVQCPGMSPVEVEQLVTYPIETSMMGMPKLQMVRSTSKLDLSMVTVIFDDSMDKYLVRQLVAERISQVQSRIPAGLQPQMNPMSTAFGEVYQYTVSAPGMSLMQLKTLHDWVIRYALLTVPGVSEINSWGGETKQYTAEIEPDSLRRFNLTLHDVVKAVTENNANFGGSYIEHAEQQYTVRGLGRAQSIDDLGHIVVSTTNGVPVLLNQVANIKTEPLPRHGAVMRDGHGETVSGMVIILRGENGQKIIQEIKAKIAGLKLPGGAKILPFYDQSDVINATTATVRRNLIEAAVLVIVILLIFLGDWRAALVVAVTIPLSLLFGFIGMDLFGISVNLMSLGAIDFGTIVDGSVVMTENCMHRLENGGTGKPLLDVVRDAAHEVCTSGHLRCSHHHCRLSSCTDSAESRRTHVPSDGCNGRFGIEPAPFCLRCSWSPRCAPWPCATRQKVLATAETGRKPLPGPTGSTVCGMRTVARWARASGTARSSLIVSIVLIVVALGSLKFIGTEFMPTLDEGSMVVTSKRLPGIALTESVAIGDHEIERDHQGKGRWSPAS